VRDRNLGATKSGLGRAARREFIESPSRECGRGVFSMWYAQGTRALTGQRDRPCATATPMVVAQRAAFLVVCGGRPLVACPSCDAQISRMWRSYVDEPNAKTCKRGRNSLSLARTGPGASRFFGHMGRFKRSLNGWKAASVIHEPCTAALTASRSLFRSSTHRPAVSCTPL